jgi:hypothetical protein
MRISAATPYDSITQDAGSHMHPLLLVLATARLSWYIMEVVQYCA